MPGSFQSYSISHEGRYGFGAEGEWEKGKEKMTPVLEVIHYDPVDGS